MEQPQTEAARSATKAVSKLKTKKAEPEPKAPAKSKKPDTDLTAALEKILGGEDEVVIHKSGKKVGAMISARAYRFLVKATEKEMDRRAVEEAERRLAAPEEKPIPYETVRKELGLD